MELTRGTVIAERFRLERKLGEGGMGAVWFAHHVALQTPCAIKFIHADVLSAEGVRARFEREAMIAAQLRSPHVVQVLDYGVSGEIPYIAMEYLEGEDLAHRIARQQRLSPRETVAIVSQVARALTKAHSAGLVHRDLKPENVFLVRDDDAEIVKVLDFGIAKSQTPQLDGKTRTGAILGTPHYMSPEQAQGTKTVDHRSDLWALGVIAYHCLVGSLPFQSDALGDLLMRIIVHPLPVPSQMAPGIPPGFDAWWARAAARDPAERFQSAKELAEALGVALGLSAPAIPTTSGTAATVAAGPAGSGPWPAATMPTPPHAYGYGTPAPMHPMPKAPAPGLPSSPGSAAAAPAEMPRAGAIPAQTIDPASRTYPGAGGPSAPSRGKGAGVFLGGATVLAVVLGGLFLVHKHVRRAERDVAASVDVPIVPPPASAPAAPSEAPAPSVEIAVSPAPVVSAIVPTVAPAPRPAPRPRAAPGPAPAPARTGRVVITRPP